MIRRLITYLITKLCHPELKESIFGDLEELYELDQIRSPDKADRNYCLNALAFLRFHRLRKKQLSKTQNHMSLFKNYVKVSLRDLTRNRTYATINLLGLVSGLTVALLIFQYVLFETGFDRFHAEADNIFRVVNSRYQNGNLVQRGTITYPTIGPTLHRDFPEVEAYTRMTLSSRAYIGFEEELYLSHRYITADEYFLNFFSFPMLHGDPATALSEPYQAVFTESFAKRLLPKGESVSSMIGKSIDLYGNPTKVTGIMKDPPKQSHLQFDLLISYQTFIASAGKGADNSWAWSDFYHYVRLTEGVTPASLDDKLEEFGIRYFKDGEVSGGVERFSLQPMLDAHMDNTMEYEIGQTIDGKVVWIMLAIACFIVVVAWINYINLTSSRSLQRAKEIGIRKSVGAGQQQIMFQFITEALLFNVISLGLSVMMMLLLQPFFNSLTGIRLGIDVLLDNTVLGLPFVLVFIVIYFLLVMFVALYPAWLITRFRATDITNGQFKLKGEARWLRKGLVVFQFALAVILINAAFGISQQVDFMIKKDLGLDIEHSMVVYGPAMTNWDSTFIHKMDRFKNEASAVSGVKMVSSTSRMAGNQMGRVFQLRNLSNPEAKDLTMNNIHVDHEFDEVLGLNIIAGRSLEFTDHNFDGNLVTSLLMNEAAVPYLGFENAEASIGRRLNFHGKDWTIVGVVNDFHQMSLHDAIEPILFLPYMGTQHSFLVKFEGRESETAIANIRQVYDAIYPGNYFDYYFLEDSYHQQYQADLRLGKISNIFTILSIIMVVLGLYGLLTMTLDRKVKEIGIRKVLGARIDQILMILSKEFLGLMMIALIVGIPLSIIGIANWKEEFAYVADFSSVGVVVSSILIIGISLLPLLIQSRKVTTNNPVESLRNE
ncbi:MAG: ABC transporter permease [Cytophagales bacterium]|nr:ABC transporter permease [Cytophagales bacterium]